MPDYRSLWTIPKDACYLNHGSFGPSPKVVQEARRNWSERLERNPMHFFLREMEDALDTVCDGLGRRVGTEGRNLVLVDNATVGMNIVARSLELQAGDEILLNGHEYGAVFRIWRSRCAETGAVIVSAPLEPPFPSPEDLVERLFAHATERTKLLVVSHVTSPTALVFPVESICREARRRGIPVCIDGPHAPAQVPVQIDRIGCDFYAASCHKWMCASFGSGFLYVHPRWQNRLRPSLISWGGSLSGRPRRWQDDYNWLGTRDPAAFLSIPTALHFLEEIGLEKFREQTHALVIQAKERIENLTGLRSWHPDESWYGSMVTVPLPPFPWEGGHPALSDPLQQALWEQYQIEIPVVRWNGHRLSRVSCHLYNTQQDIDRLLTALEKLLPQFSD